MTQPHRPRYGAGHPWGSQRRKPKSPKPPRVPGPKNQKPRAGDGTANDGQAPAVGPDRPPFDDGATGAGPDDSPPDNDDEEQ